MRFIQKFLLGAQLYYLFPFKNILTVTATDTFLKSSSLSISTSTQTSSITMATNQEEQQCSSSSCESGLTSVAFVTTPNENSAKKIAHMLVTQKLAACVNLIPNLTSIYSWEGKINEDSEILLMIKTRTNRLDELIKFVKENHPYSVAEVITLPIQNGNVPYLEWILKTVPDKN